MAPSSVAQQHVPMMGFFKAKTTNIPESTTIAEVSLCVEWCALDSGWYAALVVRVCEVPGARMGS